MSKYPDILNIPTSNSFRDLQETQVTLLFDAPKEFEGKFGPQWKYSVESGGTEYTLFASAALHRQIQETFPTKGTTISIARVGEGKETKWDVVYVSGPKGTGDSPQARERIAAGGTAPRAADPGSYESSLALYWEAFDLAMSTLSERGITPQVDANAVAFVIYKLAKDHGIASVASPNVNPAPVTVSTQAVEEDGKAKMKEELLKLFSATKLHETQHLHALRAHAPEGVEINSWDDVTRDIGLATFAAGKNVEAGIDTWEGIISPGETTDQEELPF